MQHAADNAVNWFEKAYQRINATKTQYMSLTLLMQLNVSVTPPIMINGEQIQQTKTAKLLGVTVDDHLKFKAHVTTTIEKTRAATHGLLTLKRHGVNKTSLVKYYQSRIVPILTYAAPAWYSYTIQQSKDMLERHQSLCLRLIYPNISSYSERLILTKTARLNDVLYQLCDNYVSKVAAKPDHRLRRFIPAKQSVNRHSSRLADKPVWRYRTALFGKSLFFKHLT